MNIKLSYCVKCVTAQEDKTTKKQQQSQLQLYDSLSTKNDKEKTLSLKATVLQDLQLRAKELANVLQFLSVFVLLFMTDCLIQVLLMERIKSALKVFRAMSIEVTLPSSGKGSSSSAIDSSAHTSHGGPKTNMGKQKLTGCSTILSLPLPNDGNYSGKQKRTALAFVTTHSLSDHPSSEAPFESTAMALSHAAHLTDAIAAALNIPLPHPITPFSSAECLISPQYDLVSSFSLSPVIHINERTRHADFSWRTPTGVEREIRGEQLRQRMRDSPVQQADVAAPNAMADGVVVLGSNYLVNSAFPQAVTLLQANVVSLCMRAGVPPESLWPPQAVLLNLYELLSLCATCAKRNERVAPNTASGVVSSGAIEREARLVPLPTVNGISHRYTARVAASLTRRYASAFSSVCGERRRHGDNEMVVTLAATGELQFEGAVQDDDDYAIVDAGDVVDHEGAVNAGIVLPNDDERVDSRVRGVEGGEAGRGRDDVRVSHEEGLARIAEE